MQRTEAGATAGEGRGHVEASDTESRDPSSFCGTGPPPTPQSPLQCQDS